MDINKCAGLASKMAANAKDGSLKINGATYAFKFNHATWEYHIFTQAGEELMKFNTKSLKQAREWLREYFSN
jgi:hypothetical protein